MNIFDTLEKYKEHLSLIRDSNSLLDLDYIVYRAEPKMNILRESIKDKQFKPLSQDIHNINQAISKIYYLYRDKQSDYINYDSLIEDAVYEEKFNYK